MSSWELFYGHASDIGGKSVCMWVSYPGKGPNLRSQDCIGKNGSTFLLSFSPSEIQSGVTNVTLKNAIESHLAISHLQLRYDPLSGTSNTFSDVPLRVRTANISA